MSSMPLVRIVAVCVAVFASFPALADDPTYTFAKPPDVKDPPWKGQAKLGFLSSTGNGQSVSLSAGAAVAYQENSNKLQLEGGLAYVNASLLSATDANGNGAIGAGEIVRTSTVATQAWNVLARYDRFFAELNTVYVNAHMTSDRPAGKALTYGGQVGYTRLVLKTEQHQTTFEVGADYSRELYVDPASLAVDAFSARLFASHSVKFSPTAGASISVEALDNVLAEGTAPNPALNGALGVGAFRDLRVNGVVSTTAAVTKNISLALSFKLKYDAVPAPLAPFAVPYEAGFKPFAQTLDTVLDASLLVSFL